MIDYLNNTSASVIDIRVSTHATSDYHHYTLNYDGMPIEYLWGNSSLFIDIIDGVDTTSSIDNDDSSIDNDDDIINNNDTMIDNDEVNL